MNTEILDGGVAYLASKLSLDEDELRNGVAYTLCGYLDDDWEAISEDEKDTYREIADDAFSVMEDRLFSYCMWIVVDSYIVNGKIAETQEALDEAGDQMRELSEKYSDYEHYPNLKGYYTAVNSFFEFCKSPKGTFEQLKDTINDFRTEVRNCRSGLDFTFGE